MNHKRKVKIQCANLKKTLFPLLKLKVSTTEKYANAKSIFMVPRHEISVYTDPLLR